MAGGSPQGANPSQGAGIPPSQAAVGQAALQGYNPQVQMQQLQQRPPTPPPMPAQGLPAIQNQPTKPMQLERRAALDPEQLQSIYEQSRRGYADGGQVFNPGFMQYPQQGQPNQPQGNVPLLTTQPPPVQNDGGPDAGGDYAGASMGFDGSGSDAGVGGQPVNQVQTPLIPSQQGNKPLGLAQFQQPQGLQIAGNPTSQVVQRPQQR